MQTNLHQVSIKIIHIITQVMQKQHWQSTFHITYNGNCHNAIILSLNVKREGDCLSSGGAKLCSWDAK